MMLWLFCLLLVVLLTGVVWFAFVVLACYLLDGILLGYCYVGGV